MYTNERMLTIENFTSKVLNNTRNLKIYLPASYSHTSKNYPVLYLHDGQNVFAPGSPYGCWYIERVYDKLVAEKKINEVMLVAVYNNNDRNFEYTPTFDITQNEGGNGDKYLRFLTEEVVPWVCANFRVKLGAPNTALLGSSLGGLITFYAALTYPQVFGMAACMSPSFWWNSEQLLNSIEDTGDVPATVRFWFDAGNAEDKEVDKNGISKRVKNILRIGKKLQAQGFEYGKDFLLHVDMHGQHTEASWSARVHKPLLFFFGRDSARSSLQKEMFKADLFI